MAKGYWIARIDVHNIDGYKEYVAQNGAVFKKYGARITKPLWLATILPNTPGWSGSGVRMPRAIS